MSSRLRLGGRVSAAFVATALPVALSLAGQPVGFAPAADEASGAPGHTGARPSQAPSPQVDVAPLAPDVTSLPPRGVSRLPGDVRSQPVAPQTTIEAGLRLRTKAERNRKISLTSAKGSHVWTASSLAEHDLPSAAMRAYKNAAREIDAIVPGCHLPWTLLAGIGRVESDHGRYGGSVLGNDGVPRPAIVGVALNGKGAVAAIPDTDNGRFDGDRVWDRAVGPMQFIPSTWRTAGRDGDHDGVADANDIDDASLAAAAYLCHAGNLSDATVQRSAIYSYNASDYYVDLVSAFARGYRTGVFVIPSPPAPAGADKSAAHAKHKAKQAAKKRAVLKARRLAAKASARSARHAKAAARSAAAAQARAQAPKPGVHKPRPTAPKPTATYATVSGALSGGSGSWRVGGKDFTTASAAGVAGADLDKDGTTESLGEELAGVVARDGQVSITYQVGTSPAKVTRLGVVSLAPEPNPSTSQASTPSAASSPSQSS